jgi:UDP:flavonoid glycosyltransferase YjiC (YdhE family)
LSKDLKIPISGPYRRLRKAQRPIVCGYSSKVLPKPADLPEHVHITGYWILEPAPGWKPDPKLLDFLQSGAPPVFVGFASMGNPLKAPETTDIVVQALAQAHVRGVLVSGWSGLGLDTTLPDNVMVVENAPYSWLLPQMSAIVHHGGAGTTGAGLRAGVPNIVIPHFSDNYFWGNRVVALGAGPEPIPRKRLTPERLAAAITKAVGDRNMRQRVAAIGQQLQAEDGVARAIDVFHQYLGC